MDGYIFQLNKTPFSTEHLTVGVRVLLKTTHPGMREFLYEITKVDSAFTCTGKFLGEKGRLIGAPDLANKINEKYSFDWNCVHKIIKD